MLIGFLTVPLLAQSADIVSPPGSTAVSADLPEAPVAGTQISGGQGSPVSPTSGSIHGTVMDQNGGVIANARITLDKIDSRLERTLNSDENGFFSFTSLPAGRYRATIVMNGFESWVGPAISLDPDQSYELSKIVLRIAPANVDVEAISSTYELAQVQLHAEEKQRVLGVFPNFYTSYVWNAAPLSAGQKFQLALHDSIDPVSFLGAGLSAGIEQWQNDFRGYGQGAQGYAKRFGASYADGFVGDMVGGAILPSLLRQDPRYFYKGTGSIKSRILYAISTVVICKGDNGRWQPNYSGVLGNLASAGISNIYYPASDRKGATVTIDNALIGTAEGAGSALIQEFLLRKISRGTPKGPVGQP
jgi:hypothetical protein